MDKEISIKHTTERSNTINPIPRRLKYFLIGFLSVVITLLVSQSRWADTIDFYFNDIFLRNIPARPTETPEVAIIGIDDDSLKRIKDPLVHWIGYFATIVESLTSAGAKAIMFDIIPAISLEKLAPELDIHFMKSVKKARNSGIPIFLGFKAGAIGGQMPHPKFRFQATNLGFLNIYPDSDGRVRKQPIWFMDDKGRMTSSLSLLASMAYSGDINMQKETICEKFNICIDNSTNPSIRIDYRIKQNQSNLHSFNTILEDSREGNIRGLKKRFSGKVVFIGALSDRLSDSHSVPMNPLDTTKAYGPGLLIQVQTMQSILSPFHFKDASFYFQIGITIFIASLVSFLIFILSPQRLLIFLPLIFVCGIFAVVYAFSSYFVVPVTTLAFGFLVPSIVTGAYLYTIDYRQYRTLKRYFKSYVNPQVMEEIIENPDSVHFEGNLVNISIMFTDVRNFTTLSERFGEEPDVLVRGLNKYLAEMTHAIIEADGYANRYVGDGILALFGAPNNLPGSGALAAVKCGLDMLSRLKVLNEKEIFPGVDEIRIGIGIHTGEVIVGNVGCFEKMDYSVVGDSANLASRIEDLTKTYETPMLISGFTYEIVKDHVDAQCVDCVKVKGRKKEVKIYKVLSLK